MAWVGAGLILTPSGGVLKAMPIEDVHEARSLSADAQARTVTSARSF